jgi:hypothetical protein
MKNAKEKAGELSLPWKKIWDEVDADLEDFRDSNPTHIFISTDDTYAIIQKVVDSNLRFAKPSTPRQGAAE